MRSTFMKCALTNPEDARVLLKVRVPPTIMYKGTTLAEIRYKLKDGAESFGFTKYDATVPIIFEITNCVKKFVY